MEMLIMASGGLNSIASSLGHMEGDSYIISEYCEDVLEEMLDNLKHENKVTRPVRVNIANSKVLESDLLQILAVAEDDQGTFQAILKLLVNLSMPLEVILPVHPNMTKADWEQRHTLQDMLHKIKKHFIQEMPVRALLGQMSTQLEHHGPYPMDKQSMESMNDCLVLIRNILHIEENTGMETNNEIVRHMLNNSVGDIFLNMLNREEAEIWISAMVQVIRLMFRDQMSQDLVKRATKLYEKGTLFADSAEEEKPSGTGQETTNTNGADAEQSPWVSLREASPLVMKSQSPLQIPASGSPVRSHSSGDSASDSAGDSSGDSGCPLGSDFETKSSPTISSAMKGFEQVTREEKTAVQVQQERDSDSGVTPCSDLAGSKFKGRSSLPESSGDSSGIDSPVDVSPARKGLSSPEESPRVSPTGFALADASAVSPGRESPQSSDGSSVGTTASTKKKTPKKHNNEQMAYLCRPRDTPRGSPESQASEEDDACSRTSGNGSTVSRSSDNSSSSTGTSETGSSFSSTSSMDGTPSKGEALRNLLCRFAVRFCQNGLNRCILLSQDNLLQHINDCYVLWCLSYFLPFASLPCISYSDVRYNLSGMVVTYLMFVTLNTWESFTLAASDSSADSKSNILFRRLYLLVASLRQILSMTRRFVEQKLGAEEKENLYNFIKCLCQLEGLRKLYLLLLRKFRPKNESIQYLRALVVSNDELLRIITSAQACSIEGIEQFNCEEHVRQLASRQVLLTYNEVLQKFSSNTKEENEAVFTLMYHTAVDLHKHKLIYQLPILDTFADLWEQGAEDCISKSSWAFIDYIVGVFTQHSMDNPDILIEEAAEIPSKKRKLESTEDMSEDELSPLKRSVSSDGGICVPTILSSSEDESAEAKHIKDNIKTCIRALSIKGYKPQIRGLQKLLLETCYAKLACPKTAVVEPVVWLNHIQMKSVPLFAFSQADELAMNDEHFQEILQRLGMHSAKDSQHLFPSIPAFWTAEMCFNAAKMLGDINCDKLRFAMTPEGELCPEYLEMQMPSATYEPGGPDYNEMGDEPDEKPSTSRTSNPVSSLPKNMWLSVIQQLNAAKEAKA